MLTAERALTVEQAHDQGPLQQVDPKGFYTTTIQLGARIRWRDMSGGKWELEKRDPLKNESHYRHKPAVHECEALPGKIVNGLIVAHNEWLEANKKNDILKGDVSKQVLVISTEPAERPEKEYGNKITPAMLEDLLTKVLKSVLGN